MFAITKDVRFSAGHFLSGVPEGHPCAEQHGHNYTVTIELRSELLDDTGFILDFNDIKALVKGKYDHINLNDVMERNPTAENIALDISELLHSYLFQREEESDITVAMVRVQETETGSATWTPTRSS